MDSGELGLKGYFHSLNVKEGGGREKCVGGKGTTKLWVLSGDAGVELAAWKEILPRMLLAIAGVKRGRGERPRHNLR